MAENPIRTSDLFEDDGTIKRVIEQLQQLIKIIEQMQKGVETSARSMAAETKKTTSTQQSHRETLEQNSKSVKEMERAYQNLLKAKQPIAKEIEKIKIQTSDQNKLNKAAAQSEHMKSKAAKESAVALEMKKLEIREANHEAKAQAQLNLSTEGSYNQLSAQYKQIKMELNGMSAEQRYNTERGREMEQQSKRIYDEMTRMQMATGKHQLKVGSYTEAIRSSNMSLQEMRKELRMLRDMSVEGKSSAEIQDINRAIGELDDNMKKLRMEQEAYGIDNMELMAGASQAATGAIQGLAGAMTVLGIESDILRGVQQNILHMIAVTKGLEAIERAYHKRLFQTIRMRTAETAETIRNTVAKKANLMVTQQQNRVETARARVLAATTTQKKLATTATLAFHRAVRALMGPIGWIITGLGLLAGAYALIRRRMQNASKDTDSLTEAKKRSAEAAESAGEKYNEEASEIKLLIREIENERLPREQREEAIKRLNELMPEYNGYLDEEGNLLNHNTNELNQYLKSLRERIRLEALREQMKQAIIEQMELEREFNQLQRERNRLNEAIRNEEDRIERRRMIQQRNRISQQMGVIDAELRGARLTTDAIEREIEVRQRMLHTQQQGVEASEDAVESKQKEIDMEKELEKVLRDKQQLERELMLAGMQDFERREAQAKFMLEDEKRQLNERLDALGLEESERERIYNRFVELYRERFDNQMREIDEARTEARRRELQDQYRAELEAFDQRQQLAESEFELEKRTEAEKTRFKLEQQKERYLEMIRLAEEYGEQLNEVEIQTIKNYIQQVQNELDNLEQSHPQSIWDMIGLTMKDEHRQAISQAAHYALDHIHMIIAARQAQAQAAVDAARAEVEATRSGLSEAKAALAEERRRRDEGFANRVRLAEEEVKLQEKQLEEQEAAKEKALELAEKERRRQARLEGLAQAGNLLVASTKIMAQFGLPFALPVIALMWSTFAAQRRRAKDAGTEMYGRGHFETVDVGGSHASGRDVSFPIDRRVERGEAWSVFNKKAVRKYGADSLNKMTNQINSLEFGDALANSIFHFTSQGVSTQKIEETLDAIYQQGSRSSYVDGQGRLIEKHKNITRIYA